MEIKSFFDKNYERFFRECISKKFRLRFLKNKILFLNIFVGIERLGAKVMKYTNVSFA